MDTIENARIKSKTTKKLPKGAVVLEKNVDTTVEEIENGYIVEKRYDIKYQVKDRIDWLYVTKKAYTKTNPVKITEDKMLAEYFD